MDLTPPCATSHRPQINFVARCTAGEQTTSATPRSHLKEHDVTLASPVMRENVLQTLCWPTQSTGSGVHGVVGAAVHEPVVVVCEHAHVSAIPLSPSMEASTVMGRATKWSTAAQMTVLATLTAMTSVLPQTAILSMVNSTPGLHLTMKELVPLPVTWCVCLMLTSTLLEVWLPMAHHASPAMAMTKPSAYEERALMSAVTTGLVEPNRTDVVCVMGTEALAHWFKEHFQPQISDLATILLLPSLREHTA